MFLFQPWGVIFKYCNTFDQTPVCLSPWEFWPQAPRASLGGRLVESESPQTYSTQFME